MHIKQNYQFLWDSLGPNVSKTSFLSRQTESCLFYMANEGPGGHQVS